MIPCENDTKGRYLEINMQKSATSEEEQYLTLCEVDVYGTRYVDPNEPLSNNLTGDCDFHGWGSRSSRLESELTDICFVALFLLVYFVLFGFVW